jgi:hypothetical protein
MRKPRTSRSLTMPVQLYDEIQELARQNHQTKVEYLTAVIKHAKQIEHAALMRRKALLQTVDNRTSKGPRSPL